MERWKYGKMERWKYGKMEIWKDGKMEILYQRADNFQSFNLSILDKGGMGFFI